MHAKSRWMSLVDACMPNILSKMRVIHNKFVFTIAPSGLRWASAGSESSRARARTGLVARVSVGSRTSSCIVYGVWSDFRLGLEKNSHLDMDRDRSRSDSAVRQRVARQC